ncbi:MAG TPA: PEGA domain-containing protein [Planctomycetota bacterium]
MRRLIPLALLASLGLAGCVDRLIEIRSDPPGADVYLDGERVGVTQPGKPLEVAYAFYGTRELILTKKGYRSHRRYLSLSSPWWQVFPFDFLTDVVLPFTLTDRTDVQVVLEKESQGQEVIDETLKRAGEARDKANPPPEAPK